jgi:hypothetical protein
VVFHHDDHTHPFIDEQFGRRRQAFRFHRTGKPSTDTFYRVHLTVSGPEGLKTTVTRDIYPRVVSVTVDTGTPYAPIYLAGKPAVAGKVTFASVVCANGRPAVDSDGGDGARFNKWLDTGSSALQMVLRAPGKDSTSLVQFK